MADSGSTSLPKTETTAVALIDPNPNPHHRHPLLLPPLNPSIFDKKEARGDGPSPISLSSSRLSPPLSLSPATPSPSSGTDYLISDGLRTARAQRSVLTRWIFLEFTAGFREKCELKVKPFVTSIELINWNGTIPVCRYPQLWNQ